MKDRQLQPDVMAKFSENAPLGFIDKYIDQLRNYRAISLDVGGQDGLKVNTSKMDDVLTHMHQARLRDL